MSFTPEQIKELQKKLSPDAVKPAKKYGPKGDYIEGWYAIAEANRIFGFDGWSYEIVKIECVFQGERAIGRDKEPGFGVTYVAHVKALIGDTVREDVGSGHGYDKDCGLAHESASKEAITDALKRCLRTYGNPFGLALYDKTRSNVGVDRMSAADAKRSHWPEFEGALQEVKNEDGLRAVYSGLLQLRGSIPDSYFDGCVEAIHARREELGIPLKEAAE